MPNTLQLGTATGFACGAVIPLKTPNSQSFLPLPVPAAQSDSKAVHWRQEVTFAGLAPLEGKQDQGECELGGLHVGFRALSDTPTLIFWYIMDILSEKVHPYREANIKRIQIKLAFVRFLLGGGVQTLACMVCGTFLPLKQ